MTKLQPDLQHLLPCPPPDLEDVASQLLAIRKDILQKEASHKNLQKVHPRYQKSARNLLQYLAFRLHDVRDLQLKLSDLGLSSMGRAERKVQATIDTVLAHLHLLAGKEWKPKEKPIFCYQEGRRMLEENTDALLGEATPGRRVRIMVTMPSEAADNYDLVKNLMLNGMNCARINCAHDGPEVWGRMVANIRHAEETTARKCKILMDLCGPKLRTGELLPGPAVLKVRPKRSDLGEVHSPAHIWFYPKEAMPKKAEGADVALQMPGKWLQQCREGDSISLNDARGAKRELTVTMATPEGIMATSLKTVYFAPGLKLELKRKGRKNKKKSVRLSGELPRKPGAISLQADDLLWLRKSSEPGHGAFYDESGKLHPAAIGCSIPEVLDDVQVGEPIWFDDGNIGGIIEQKEAEQVQVRITLTRPGGKTLRSEKGINLPESNLRLTALSAEDLEALKFVVKYADMVGLSFANTPKDVEDLILQMKKLGKEMPGIVLKIETPRGFDNLPSMLLKAMETPLCGVMIARGDLAIECGFGRLAEVQEQILWICEAAHVPVIWATQVLEGLAKQGMPTRAEVTDAAMGERAECIMLNKGDHIVLATRALSDILNRMQDHQTKKRSLLRKLNLAEKFFFNHV
ncbi:MAG: pyruvate kinase [Saprospiraceae bacterium]